LHRKSFVEMKLKPKSLHYRFTNKRNYKLKTPCCGRSNADGKFVNYKGLADQFGYCHSCGQSSLPRKLYEDELGNLFYWNNKLFKYDMVETSKGEFVIQNEEFNDFKCNTNFKFIDIQVVKKSMIPNQSNNLLNFLHKKYNKESVTEVCNKYYVGTTSDGFSIFWMINKMGKVQKSKEVWYSSEGKRSNKFRVPYKNEDGYYSCLYGEHLIDQSKPIVLVESEKSAIICAIEFPQYTWLAYGGLTALTTQKLIALKNQKMMIN